MPHRANSCAPEKTSAPIETWLFWGLLLVGLAVRIFGAWAYRDSIDGDADVVALMTLNMLHGKDFPVFFYGQAYMGNIEPLASVVLCYFFGFSRFMVALGTALMAFSLLPIVYFWARDAAGPRAGRAAMLSLF